MQEYTEFFQNNMILVLIWAAVFVALISSFYRSMTAKYKILTPNQLTQTINQDNGIVLDIRTKDEFKQGHISNAIHCLPSDIKSGNITAIEKYKTTPITVVCKTGQTAHEIANLLIKQGFEKVNILKNGIISWNDGNLPLVSKKSLNKKNN